MTTPKSISGIHPIILTDAEQHKERLNQLSKNFKHQPKFTYTYKKNRQIVSKNTFWIDLTARKNGNFPIKILSTTYDKNKPIAQKEIMVGWMNQAWAGEFADLAQKSQDFISAYDFYFFWGGACHQGNKKDITNRLVKQQSLGQRFFVLQKEVGRPPYYFVGEIGFNTF